jgi:hypothetical protein
VLVDDAWLVACELECVELCEPEEPRPNARVDRSDNVTASKIRVNDMIIPLFEMLCEMPVISNRSKMDTFVPGLAVGECLDFDSPRVLL